MVKIERINGIDRYVVVVPEESLFQDFNPNTQMPFASESEAIDFENKFRAAKPKPGAPVPPPTPRVLTKWEFSQRFTFAERVAITTAAKTDAEVEVIMNDMSIAQEIHLDDKSVEESLALLVSKGLLKADRVTSIKA